MSQRRLSGGVHLSTTADLLRWEHGLFGGKVLSDASLMRMTTAGKGDYGLGVAVSQRAGLKVVDHGGGIEGFNTWLAYVPEKRIAVVVLSNVNGAAPGVMGSQLLDVALDRPVELTSERKAVVISKEELAKFAGTYELAPNVALSTGVTGDGLTAQVTGQGALPLIYVGVKDGHLRFLQAQVGAELEFVPDAGSVMTTVVLHQGGHDTTWKRR